MNVEIIAGIIFLIVILIGVSIGRCYEKKQWNNGVCSFSNKPWKLFDYDSQGGRGYTDGEGNYCWISYKVDKIK